MASYKYKLYGAILGDLAGQPYEFKKNGYDKPFNLRNPDSVITDDTIMTLATAASLISGLDIQMVYKGFGERYPGDHYGKGFKEWLSSKEGTINDSWGNGCLMRISPFMYADTPVIDILKSISQSHNNHISYKAVIDLYHAYKGKGLAGSGREVEKFNKFEVRADLTVDFCINLCKWENSTQPAIYKAVDCDGDTDTNASIVGELMNYHYKDLTEKDVEYVESKLDPYLLNILKTFNAKYA